MSIGNKATSTLVPAQPPATKAVQKLVVIVLVVAVAAVDGDDAEDGGDGDGIASPIVHVPISARYCSVCVDTSFSTLPSSWTSWLVYHTIVLLGNVPISVYIWG